MPDDMKPFNDASFPPRPWDPRLSSIACRALQPISTVHENPWFAVRNRGGYFTVEYHATHVAVFPVIEDRWVVMVRVKRPVIDDMTLEFPAGGTEPGEDSVRAAAREFAEETGIQITNLSRFVPMPPLAVSSTRMPRLSYVFRVNLTDGEFASRGQHDEEIYSVERVDVQDLPRMMSQGMIYVSVPLAILGLYLSTKLAQLPEFTATRT